MTTTYPAALPPGARRVPPAATTFVTRAHRGRGVMHQAERVAITDDRRILLSTSALCGASTATGVYRGRRRHPSLRPGESTGELATCLRCATAGRPFPMPGRVIPLAALEVTP